MSHLDGEDKKILTVNLSLDEYTNLHYFQTLLENSAVTKSDLEGNITYVNDKFIKITGFSEDELLGQNHRILQHPDNDKDIFKSLWETIKKGNIWRERLSYKTLTTTQKLIAIGSSTGGTEALKTLLSKMPANTPGILVTQHMPASFTLQFANRLNDLCAMEVKEAQNGDPLGIGKVLIAPGDKHMVLRRSGARYYVEVGEGKKVSGHRPSVDVLFNSVAKSAGKNAIGIILTGMGSDGAKGLLNLKKSGAITLGQDEASCVVYGMPKVAYDLGAVKTQVPISEMATKILEKLSAMKT